MLFEKFDDPEELFAYKRGSALKMERTVLDMLDHLEEKAQNGEIKRQFRHHADETREHGRNVERPFNVLGEDRTTTRTR